MATAVDPIEDQVTPSGENEPRLDQSAQFVRRPGWRQERELFHVRRACRRTTPATGTERPGSAKPLQLFHQFADLSPEFPVGTCAVGGLFLEYAAERAIDFQPVQNLLAAGAAFQVGFQDLQLGLGEPAE